ncbi:neutral zinc metallopeptidase [Aldersonia sp. NBC_00410]|uniref:neutral zinc metallopeptidase n=1 Tax=Aldersonia sp. NBC_00410 TaxID=2975954 RepID=UPI002251DAEC|nr:neutral zinc metallopeptidase [Aldersonia sp. NBC_00410]MCX5042282.1 neutral zinc metallopeptidase [Aldersonia sp. NBC_00410]
MTSPTSGGMSPGERRLLVLWVVIAVLAVAGAAVVIAVRFAGGSDSSDALSTATGSMTPSTAGADFPETGVPLTAEDIPPAPVPVPPTVVPLSSSTRASAVSGLLPIVPGAAQPVNATAANPLTTVGVSLSRQACKLPGWGEDAAAETTFLQAALGCLDTAWRPILERLKLPFAPASVVVTETVTGGQCSAVPAQSSFYCDGTIYLVPASYRNTTTGARGVPAAAMGMLAHEYGHHLQRLSGTLAASVEQMNAAGRGTPEGLELSRRAELQAQCLSGMFFGVTFDPPSVALAQQDNYTRGDQPGGAQSHGTPQSWGDWFTKGLQRNSLDVCNTWVALPNAVS